MSNPFAHHAPGPRAQAEMKLLREKFAELYAMIVAIGGQTAPAEKRIALERLREAAMWANLTAVTCDPRSVPESDPPPPAKSQTVEELLRELLARTGAAVVSADPPPLANETKPRLPFPPPVPPLPPPFTLPAS